MDLSRFWKLLPGGCLCILFNQRWSNFRNATFDPLSHPHKPHH